MYFLSLLLLGSSLFLCQIYGVTLPPSITTTFQPEYYLANHGTVEFKVDCTATGSGSITYKWKVNGAQINDYILRRVFPNGTLFISVSNDTFQPYGEYQCFAENSGGTALSNKFALIEPKLSSFPTKPTSTQTATEFQYKSIKCEDRPTCRPAASCSTEWKIGEGTENTIDVTGERIALDSDGTLHFLYVLDSDQQVRSYYGCGVWNKVVSLLAKGSLTELYVTSVANPSLVDAEIKYYNAPIGVVGKSVELQCIASGYPIPSIRWYKKDDVEITGGDKYELKNFNRILKINALTADDEQGYKCSAVQTYINSNNVANKKTTTLNLNVTGPPQATKDQMSNVVDPEGNDIKFSCVTTSLPNENEPSTPIWYYNGARITTAEIGPEQRYQTESDGKVLVIKNIRKSNSGSFQCQTSNSEGVFMRAATLVVIDPIVVSTEPPNSFELLPEEVKYIGIEATTDAPYTLKYSWTFINTDGDVFYNNNSVNTFPSQLVLSSDRKNLTLDGSNLEGSNIYTIVGTYKVQVHHEEDGKMFETTVTTDDTITPGPVVVTSAGGFNPIIIAIILGVIVLFIVIFLIVCLLYRNRGGTYPLDKKELAAGHDPEKELANSGFHDLSRADGFDDEKPTNDRMSLNDSEKDYDSDDDLDQEYGMDFDTSKFNEDGSFIGQYADSKRHQTNQSVV